MATVAQIAAEIHRRMCENPGFGYSWEERWGFTAETWVVFGMEYTVWVGDYDCSSSVITAWKIALQGTPWEGSLDAATYTGNILPVFLASGLFDQWDTYSTSAQIGDLYLNIENHVAMCQNPEDPDLLSEFCWGDNGAYGNQRGDQSGYEAYVHDFYEYWDGWDCTVHYNGKADGSEVPSNPNKTEARGLQLYASNGTDAQKWKLNWIDKTWFTLENIACGKVLDVVGASSENGAGICVYPFNDGDNQKWRFEKREGDNDIHLVPKIAQDKCLDCIEGGHVQGTGLTLWTQHNGSNQDWILFKNPDGTVTFINNSVGEKLALDVIGGGAA